MSLVSVISKNELKDGVYYEGSVFETDEFRVARWNAQKNYFEYVMHYAHDTRYRVPMSYSLEPSEYWESFQPLLVIEPKDYEKVEICNG